MNITCKCREMTDGRNVILTVQNRLIKVRNAPSLRNVEVQGFCKLRRCFFRDRISPCSERNQKLVIFIKRKIPMHHSGKTDSAEFLDRNAILVFYILLEISVTLGKSVPDRLFRIGPDPVKKLVLPFLASRSDRITLFIDQNSLDTSRTEFDSQNAFSLFNQILRIHLFHLTTFYQGICPS